MGFLNLNIVAGLAVTGTAVTASWLFRKRSLEEKMGVLSKSIECAVCLDTLALCNMTVLSCGHGFHYECIDTWRIVDCHRCTCPMCRQRMSGYLLWEDYQGLAALAATWVVLDMGIII